MTNGTKTAIIGAACFVIGRYLGTVSGYVKGVYVMAEAYIDNKEREALKEESELE